MLPVIKEGSVIYIITISYGLRIPFSSQFIIRWGNPAYNSVIAFFDPTGRLSVKRCISVKQEKVYVKGDNDTSSVDSRNYGYIPIENIIGNVLIFSD